ncbi:MAG: hypothetical protein QUS07_07145 [Methanothrix sp.]|nr:hypothetical protein [Methanothrix sp.]
MLASISTVCGSRWASSDRFDVFEEELDIEQVRELRTSRALLPKQKNTPRFLLTQEVRILLGDYSRKTLYVEKIPGCSNVRIFWSKDRHSLQILRDDRYHVSERICGKILLAIRAGNYWISAV